MFSASILCIVTLTITSRAQECKLRDGTLDCSKRQLKDMPEFGDVSRVFNLDMKDNQINTLNVGVFDLFVFLFKLYLNNNNITHLTVGIFDTLTRLQTLDMEYNKITVLTPGMFNTLKYLRFLSIKQNRLEEVQLGTFEGLKNVQTLKINWNVIPSLPDKLFDGLTRITVLRYDRNNITGPVPAGYYDDMIDMEELYINRNYITGFAVGQFDALTRLRKLVYVENMVKGLLPIGIFDSLSRLYYLDNDVNLIEALPVGIFDAMIRLEYLYLQENPVTELKVGLFDKLPNLAYLLLDDLSITEVPIGLFDVPVNDKFIDVMVQLPSLKADTCEAYNLRYINNIRWSKREFQRNRVSSLEVGLFDHLTNLRRLYFTSNNITHLPIGLFDKLTRLRELRMHDNPLWSLDVALFNPLRSLKELTLPGLCNCTENKMVILPFLEKASFDVIVYNVTKRFTSLWIKLTYQCNSSFIDWEYCYEFENDETMVITTDSTEISTASTELSTESTVVSTESKITKLSNNAVYADVPSLNANESNGESILNRIPTVEGMFYSVISAIIACIIASTTVAMFYRTIQMLRTKKDCATDVVEEVIEEQQDRNFYEEFSDYSCTNTPPLRY